MTFTTNELEEMIRELGYTIDDLDDIELLAACTNTCITCKNCVSNG